MRKTNLKIILLLLLSFSMIGHVGVFATNSFYINGSEIGLNSEPKTADPYTLHIGAWIIVAGDRESDHDLFYMIESSCNNVYNSIISLGFTSDNIYYLAGNWDGSLPPNAVTESTRSNLEYAITTWAQSKVDENNGLGIYIIDHGGNNVLGLPGPNLSPNNLNSYLDSLESTTEMTRSVIIVEACHSGSFINPVSKDGRIVICATDIEHNSYPNPELTHAVFSEHLWAAITMGYRLGYCFEYATECVDIWGLSHAQKPWIDDNHDEIGHEVNINTGQLPSWGDGWDANDVTLGEPVFVINYVNFVKFQLKRFVPTAQAEIPLWVIADNNTEIEYIRARVFPWWWEWPEPTVDENGTSYFTEADFSGMMVFDLTLDPESSENGEKNYTTSIEMLRYPALFGEGNGDYKILFEAKATNGSVAQPIRTTVTLNDDGEAPNDLIPPSVIITNPKANMQYNGTLNITVEGDDEQALDKIQILLDGELLDETNMPSYYPYPEAEFSLDTSKHVNGIHNITAIAIDKSGNVEQTSVFVNFQNSAILNFKYSPYLIGAGIGVGLSLVSSLIFKRKKK